MGPFARCKSHLRPMVYEEHPIPEPLLPRWIFWLFPFENARAGSLFFSSIDLSRGACEALFFSFSALGFRLLNNICSRKSSRVSAIAEGATMLSRLGDPRSISHSVHPTRKETGRQTGSGTQFPVAEAGARGENGSIGAGHSPKLTPCLLPPPRPSVSSPWTDARRPRRVADCMPPCFDFCSGSIFIPLDWCHGVGCKPVSLEDYSSANNT